MQHLQTFWRLSDATARWDAAPSNALVGSMGLNAQQVVDSAEEYIPM